MNHLKILLARLCALVVMSLMCCCGDKSFTTTMPRSLHDLYKILFGPFYRANAAMLHREAGRLRSQCAHWSCSEPIRFPELSEFQNGGTCRKLSLWWRYPSNFFTSYSLKTSSLTTAWRKPHDRGSFLFIILPQRDRWTDKQTNRQTDRQTDDQDRA